MNTECAVPHPDRQAHVVLAHAGELGVAARAG